jgi:hypothetical protein
LLKNNSSHNIGSTGISKRKPIAKSLSMGPSDMQFGLKLQLSVPKQKTQDGQNISKASD